MKKRIVFQIILAVVLCVLGAACADIPEAWYQSGYYRYVLLEDGTARIDRYSGQDEVIEIPAELDGHPVTSIGNEAFAIFDNNMVKEYEGPTRVTIQEGVTSIGNRAFYRCTRLESVFLPESLVSIGDLAFQYTSVSEIALPDGLTELGANPFWWIPTEHIRISPDHPCFEIRNGMLISRKDGCLICGPDAGEVYCIIPEGIRRIGDYAFCGRRQLTGVTFPDSLSEIGNFAFLDCSSLENISFPAGLTSIGNHAFEGCICYYQKEIMIPDSVTWIGEDPFSMTRASVRCSANHPYLEEIDGMLYTKPDHRLIHWNRWDLGSQDIRIAEGTTAISGAIFYGSVFPEGFRIPESVTYIGDRAFEGTGDMESISYSSYPLLDRLQLPDSLQSIGDRAFCGGTFCWLPAFMGGDASFNQVVLPESMTDIGEESFAYSAITSITVPGGVKAIPRGAFRDCKSLNEAVLSDGVAWIGESAFADSAVAHVVLPDSLRFIGDYAFSGCPMTDITLPEGLQYIGTKAFAHSGLTSLTIPDSVTALGILPFYESQIAEIYVSPDHPLLAVTDGTLLEKSSMKAIYSTNGTIPEGTRIIGPYLININVRSTVIPDTVVEIEDHGFDGARRLNAIDIPGTVRKIGSYAFAHDQLESVTLAEGTEEIGDFAFSYNLKLTGIRIPDSVTRIGKDAFSDCNHLVITVSPGSYAEQYCIENGLNYVNP